MSECGNSKYQSAERCFQVCQRKQGFCLVNGKFSVGYQSFTGLQRVLDESPQFVDRYGSAGEVSAVKKQLPAKSRRQ